ncbi:ribosomal protein L7/L12 [Litorihabitans aurantiacus]|uniref:Large ribosomal subunit protein bL12 C-terminal domain-containing protein n=1 Tax=Litorihabitans aurantiacus TaxID=1930061 RepID=A0AA37XDB3_9MICO|nr:ribosomal protein L7/L12 [Litorihabitans aurantiacus]GMA30793.1 hypothetical protein GCM10025875_07850 [Litorihabitans aurantiacus]
MGLFSAGDPALERRVVELERQVRELSVRLAALERGGAFPGVSDAPVAAVGRRGAPAWGSPVGYEPSELVIDLLRRNRKIEAIKRVREETGWGLKEAKHTVDRMDGRY